MAATFSGRDLVLEGFLNIFKHIISHIWTLIFPIFNLLSSLIVLLLTRYQNLLFLVAQKQLNKC